MGAYRNESDYIRETRSQWNSNNNSNMESGGIGNLIDKFSEIGVHNHQHHHQESSSPKDNNLFQVMKAVEAAETTIKQQVEVNNRLRAELQKRTQELGRYKSDESSSPRPQSGLQDEHVQRSYNAQRPENSSRNQDDRVRWTDNATVFGSQGALVLQQNGVPRNEHPALHTYVENQHYSEPNKLNGTLSQLSSPSSRSLSPNRYLREREFDSKMNLSGRGLVPVSEQDSQSSPWKKELVLKVREHEEEILQLRKHLGEYSIREAQIRNEKYALEKRIAYMRMAFDQQQQDLVDAASKSISYRQDIIEENIRLTYALQATQQERSIFISSLLPLLEDYSLQPPGLDAQSIVSNLKVLFKHLQEKLILTEAKLKESHYQLAPWRSESLNPPSFIPQSQSQSQAQSPSRSPTLNTSNENGLELVPQPAYSHSQTPISAQENTQAATDWNSLGQRTHQTDFVGDGSKSPEPHNLGRSLPCTSRNPATQDVSARDMRQGDFHNKHFSEENAAKQLSFNDYLGSGGMDDSDAVGDSGREPSPHWSSGNSPYMTPTHDDPSTSYSPYLPAVLEEPSSSFSEAGEDDPLPGIEGLQISGEAFPGRDLQACGYSINGTTSCNFEWVRYWEDGSVHYIEGAKQPNYLVTADDVDSYLAIHVQPLDNRKRKGELVKVFANEQIKIALDPDMQEQIEKTLHTGHASYEVSVAVGYLDIWEPAILAIKREGYSIKCNGPRGVVVTEKFLPITTVTIPYGSPTSFSISGAGGVEHPLKTTDSSALRDTIVLTMRLFIMRAVEKRKGKKKGLFFHK